MTTIKNEISNTKTPHESDSELARYKIKKELVECFRVGEYRYSKLADAVAEGKRRESAKGMT